jgi:asparagine synthase (glutamine-hydrolysing)
MACSEYCWDWHWRSVSSSCAHRDDARAALMCGIAGILALQRPPKEIAQRVAAMNLAQHHRGPDSDGLAHSSQCNAVLGHTRLRIIDLTATGAQPMSTADGAVSISFNGEVYNFQALRSELESLGYAFRGRSDTEVVLNAYHRWGVESFRRLNGMYAFAVTDERSRCVHLVRDRLGIKPLHYAIAGGAVIFGSEIKALLASGLLPVVMRAAALAEYMFFGNSLGTQTLYDGVQRLLPGSFLTLETGTGKVTTTRFWSPEAVEPRSDSYEQAVEHVRELLYRAVEHHLIADVPVGVFLSGGVDSSALVALASRHYSGRLRTYSVGFDFMGDGNELPRARALAERFKTDHHELHLRGGDLPHVVEIVAASHDAPFADSADIPLYQLCRALDGETRVVLQGDGGDEIFAGYRRYEFLDETSIVPKLLRATAALLQPALMLGGVRAQGARRFLRALTMKDPVQRMALLLTVEELERSPLRVLSPHWREQAAAHDPFQRYAEVFAGVRARDPVDAMLKVDVQILLPDIFLQKVDRSTMATSTEVRVPFLDNDLVEYALGLPSHYKVRFGEKKRILRAALRGIVPDEILDGRKIGFGVPVSAWLRGPLLGYMRERLSGAAVRRAGVFEEKALQESIDEHVTGRRDNGQLLWKCLQLALWWERNESLAGGR